MKKSSLWKIPFKIILWTLICLTIIVVSVPFLLYVPFVQDVARKIAVEKVRESTGMDIDISYLRLRFPLNLQVDSLRVIEASGDTLLTAGEAKVSVALMPLFHKNIEVNSVALSDASYRLGTPDSAMYLTARISQFDAADTDIPLSFSRISLRKAVLDGADINLVMKDTTVVTPPDTAAAKPLTIDVGDIELRNVSYRMTMLPVIDSLGVNVGLARLSRGHIDTGRQLIDVESLAIDSVTAAYLTPDAAYLKSRPAEPADTVEAAPSAPWTITARHLSLTAREGLYATRGAKPAPGFDAQYISVSNVALEVDSFYNRASAIRVPLRHFAASERCGLSLMASGTFSMDSLLMRAENFNVATTRSNLYVDASMGIGDITTDMALPLGVRANGVLSLLDTRLFMPSLGAYFASLPASAGLDVNIDVHGTPASLDVDRLMLDLPGYIALNASGRVDNPMDFNRMRGQVDFSGRTGNLNSLKSSFLPAATARQVSIPATTIRGAVRYSPGNIDGDVALRTSAGELALDGRWNQKAEGYAANLNVRRFPVNAFMPSLGVGEVTADVELEGRGYNPASRSTHIRLGADLRSVVYNGNTLGNIKLKAALDTCRLTAAIDSDNPFADFDADVAATFYGGGYQWDLSTDIRQLDLKTLRLSQTPMNGSLTLYTSGSYYPRSGDIDAEVEVNDLSWMLDSTRFDFNTLTAQLLSTDTLTRASLVSGDFNARMVAESSIMSVIDRLTRVADRVQAQIRSRKADIDSLQRSLPIMSLDLAMGQQNPIYTYLSSTTSLAFNSATVELANDSLISFHARVSELKSGSVLLDNVSFDASQHGKYLVYTGKVDNNPGTMDDFAHVSLNGFLADDKVSAMIRQLNIKGEQGFMIGFNAELADSAVTMRLVPTVPTIAYKKWRINNDNFISYNFVDRHIDADLKVMQDSSYLQIYTDHPVALADSVASGNKAQEDIIIKLANINLQEWLSISPFAPPVKGDVNADLRFRWSGSEITGNGNVALNDLYYGRERVGTFDLDVDVANDSKSKALHADVALKVDGQKVMTAVGALNDSAAVSPFLLDFRMIHFPLRVVNPFLPKDIAQLSGMLNGTMDITGDMANPVFNGYLDFDSTAVTVGMTGASYKFSEERIPVDSNIVRFKDFSILGLNGHPLSVNGIVDARHISDINFDLSLKASDMQIVNSDRARKGADLYGKAYIDLDATAKGNLDFMRVDASLNLLPGTNVTYVMTDAQTALSSRSNDDMVRFVNFADTTNVAAADSLTSSSMSMMLEANLIISEGSTINVDLSTDGKNKVSIQGAGNFDYLLTPLNGDGRLTGRFTINSGFVRYTPSINTGGVSMSIMSEKNFKFQEGSYVSFTGDIMNPSLNIQAYDRLKANVTQTGQNSRLVNFDVIVSVTNTLENLNVAFNLSTDDDITIQNELASMSPEQRANQAMNMLLYNTYTGPGTKANANLTGNPLYSFLTSQLNSWAANNIKGVDISFGIDQYDTTTDGAKSTTTSYSYRVTKTLFNDRFKVVVGGNYSTDADADENFSQNLINDIAFEYMLNRSGSMYVRLFRHVGYESILEGEITQTGVGFVMKRKLNSLKDLFRLRRQKKASANVSPALPADSTVKNNETDPIR